MCNMIKHFLAMCCSRMITIYASIRTTHYLLSQSTRFMNDDVKNIFIIKLMLAEVSLR